MLLKQYNSDHKTSFIRSGISSQFSFHYFKKFFFLFGFLCFFLNTFAEHIDSTDAAFIAKNIYWERAYPKEWTDYDNLLPELVYVKSVHDTVLYYIFNVSGKKGYVIVTADDRLLPVIGYAKKGAYGIGDPPPAFIAWMDAREKEILYAVRNKIQANDFIESQWNYYRSLDPQMDYSNRGAVAPLLDPIAWGQGCYYNDSCPVTSGPCGHSVTGCVATATAMVMKYHDHPEHGSGDHSYYHSTYGLLSADFGSTTYDWAGMPEPDLTTYDPDVAQLMYHVGVSVEMNYGVGMGGSGAYTGDAAQALIDYFNYASSVSYIAKSSYSSSEWEDTLKYELNDSRPMIYRGTGPNGGHAFVCDGYDDNYSYKGSLYFHFNWGWRGNANGYFQLSLLNPDPDPPGNPYNFTTDQKAVIGITPANVNNPCSFNTITVSTTQIDLSFTCNGDVDNVVIVYNTSGTFSTPSDGSPPPAPGNSFAGGTVFYKGTSSPQSHMGLTPNNNYYYKAWSYDGSDIYSTGIEDDANTSPGNWKGTASSDWNTNGNWLGNSVPTISNNVIIGSGCPNYPVLSGTANCDDCTIDGPGAKLTVNTNAALTIDGNLINAGGGCEFEMNGGTCTITGNFYSDVGCIVDINGGILNFTNWRRSPSSSWSKGTIELSGGTINALGGVAWSSSGVNGTMDGPFELFIGGYFRNRSTGWTTVTDGTITMTGSSGSGPFYCYANYFNYDLIAYNLVFDGAGKTFYLNHYSLCPTNLHVVNDLTVNAGTVTSINAGSKNEYIDVDGDLLINPEGKLTAETTSHFYVWGDAELQSNSPGTASLIQDANFNVYGDTYVMRYIPSNDDWHYVSSPVSSAYSGVFAGTYMNSWDEPSYLWQHIQNLTTPLNVMQGYSVKLPYIYGNTAEFEGTLNTGNISSPELTYTNTGSPSTDGFNLIGNPYPSSIDWDLATPLLPTGVDDAIYYWDPAAAQYKVYSMTGGGSGSQYIPPMQAVFIHCNSSLGTSETIDLNNSVRTHDGSSTFYKNKLIENILALKVTGEKYADETFIHINPSATAGFDGHYDAYKLFSPYKEVPHLYTTCNDLNLSINSLPFTGDEMIINLAFRSETPGLYTFDIQGVEKFVPGKPLFLVDRKEKMYIDLRQQSDYSYSYDIEEPEERFIICFKKSIVDEECNKFPVNIYSFDRRIYIKTFQEGLSGQVYIYNILGQLMDYIDFQNKYFMEIDLKHSDRIYIVKLIANGEVYTQKLIIN